MSNPFRYGIDHLTPFLAVKIARGEVKALLTEQAKNKIKQSHEQVARMSRNESPVYGVNTGFGPLCTTRIPAQKTSSLQKNILMSHSCGVGDRVDPFVTKLMLILKAHALSFGFSGVAQTTIERIVWHIDQDQIPVVPSQGSVGASGDLAPLSHLFLPLIGMGAIHSGSTSRPTEDLMSEYGMQALVLGPKEGLALINGTQFMAAHAIWGLYRMYRILNLADTAGAMTLDALLGSVRPFQADLHRLRPHGGQIKVANNLMALLNGSELVHSHATCLKVQDPYSLRCMPQIHGASRDAWQHLYSTIDIEINSVTDNPIILGNGESVSGGHFHGQPIALPLDYATLAASELGNVSDRRLYLLLNGDMNKVPKFLIHDSGLNSGFMILQYTTAALTSENKTLCMPASADSIPTSLGQEDHVSMGSISARKFNRVLDNLERIIAIELMSAAQALDFQRPLKSGPLLEAVHVLIRKHISHTDSDRIFSSDIETMHSLIVTEQLSEAIDAACREFNLNIFQPEA